MRLTCPWKFTELETMTNVKFVSLSLGLLRLFFLLCFLFGFMKMNVLRAGFTVSNFGYFMKMNAINVGIRLPIFQSKMMAPLIYLIMAQVAFKCRDTTRLWLKAL